MTHSIARARLALRPLLAFASLALGSLSGCGTATPIVDGANPDPKCQPITGDAAPVCFLPFPSSYYLKADATSATGYRVNIPVGVLPPRGDVNHTAFDPSAYNQLDGFSPNTYIVADLAARVDVQQLPPSTGIEQSMLATSPVQILDYKTGERFPLWAEVDANTDAADSIAAAQALGLATPLRQALLINPAMRLKPATRYVVVLQNIKDTAGAPIVVKPFRALVDGKVASGSALMSVKPRYDEILAFLDGKGFAREGLTLAWDFVTASDAQGTGNMLKLRDAAFARWASDKLTATVDTVTEITNDDHLVRRIEGHFDVPSFLTSTTDRAARLVTDDKGQPKDSGKNFPAYFRLHIPRCMTTATAARPVLIYGHGLFGNPDEIDGGDDKLTMDTLCMIEVSTFWLGLAEGDESYVASRIGSYDELGFLFDRLQQGVLNQLVLARLAARTLPTAAWLTGLPGTPLDGKPLVDGTVYYYGNSEGGIYGNTVEALSPEILRGVNGVGGGQYAFMVQRSTDFGVEKAALNGNVPDQESQQIWMALSQSLWDFTDPATFVSHSINDPFPDDTGAKMPAKHILQQIGIDDGQVNNLATHFVMRTLGIPLLDKPVHPVYGLTAKAGPLDSALVEFDYHVKPALPTTNVVPADGGEGETWPVLQGGHHSVHETVRRDPLAIEQMRRFLTPTGKVEQTCNNGAGPCDFPMP